MYPILIFIFILIPYSSGNENEYCSYSKTSMCCKHSQPIFYPETIEEIQDKVKEANEKGLKMKAYGSRHSATDLICTPDIPIDMVKMNKIQVDPENMIVTAEGGTKMWQIYEELTKHHLSLEHSPAYSGISLAGAIGTGAHGSTLKRASCISDYLISMKIVDGVGDIQIIEQEEDLKAFRIHLGLLGIIVEVKLKVVPIFKMRMENKEHQDSILFDYSLQKAARETDFFQFWWFPSTNTVVTANGTNIPYNSTDKDDYTTHLANVNNRLLIKELVDHFQETRNKIALNTLQYFTQVSLYRDTIIHGIEPFYTPDGEKFVNPAFGLPSKLMANKCRETPRKLNDGVCPWSDPESEAQYFSDASFTLDIRHFNEVFTDVKNILNDYQAYFLGHGIFIRFSKRTEAHLAKTYYFRNFHFEWISFSRKAHNLGRDGLAAYQAISQLLVFKYQGKAHWGKNGAFFHNLNRIKTCYFWRKPAFVKAMNKFDPNGVFLNNFGERVKEISDNLTIFPEIKNCALEDYCICKENKDCAHNQNCFLYKTIQETAYPIEPGPGRWDIKVCRDNRNSLIGPVVGLLPTFNLNFTLFVLRNSRRRNERPILN